MKTGKTRPARVLWLLACVPWAANALQVVDLLPVDGDMTPVVRKALESVREADVKIVLHKGRYFFRPDYAVDLDCFITNHGNGRKRIVFPMRGFASVQIEGNGAELVFHGQVAPFLFEDCAKVEVSDLTVDWDIPFTFLGEVVAVDPREGWRDIRPFTEGFSWRLADGRLLFPDIDGFSYTEPGSTLAFEAGTKKVCDGALDLESRPRWVEKRAGGILRFHEPLAQYPPVGSLLSSKGDREHDRYAPAFHAKHSSNIRFDGVVVHHALGMGFLFERSADITLSHSGVHLREGSPRVVSSTADATHFCNCRGGILVEHCRFENMLDDGTNVHGTYVEVDAVLDARTVRVELKHFEQLGFVFAEKGDRVWFIVRPEPGRAGENEVDEVRVVNDRFTELVFKDPLPATLSKGDLLENKTWNPSFTMRGCTVRNHRARNIVLKTPGRIVVEDNDFSSMMSSVFFRGESYFWFESGAVGDVLIRNNRFSHCAYSAMEHAVLYVTPRLGGGFDDTIPYDRNIRFEDNRIETFGNRIVWADRVDGLVIRGNIIRQTKDGGPRWPNAGLIDLRQCRNVEIAGNTYEGNHAKTVLADEATKATLVVGDNKGL